MLEQLSSHTDKPRPAILVQNAIAARHNGTTTQFASNLPNRPLSTYPPFYSRTACLAWLSLPPSTPLHPTQHSTPRHAFTRSPEENSPPLHLTASLTHNSLNRSFLERENCPLTLQTQPKKGTLCYSSTTIPHLPYRPSPPLCSAASETEERQ